MKNCLFVGGCADGKVMGIPEPLTPMRGVSVPVPVKVPFNVEYGSEPYPDFVENDIYRLESIATPKRIIKLYVHEHLDMDQVVFMLLNRYGNHKL